MDRDIDAEKVKTLRSKKMLSLRELQEKSGVTQNNIWKIEQGRTKRPHPSTMRKLATALGVEPQQLLKEGE